MLYEIQKTSQKGQVLLVATDKRGVNSVVSVQMPEVRARQIVAALDFVETMARRNSHMVPHLMADRARNIAAFPIEKE